MMTSHPYETRRLRMLGKLSYGNSVLDIGYAQQPNPNLGHMHRVGFDLNRPSRDVTVQYEEELVGDASRIGESLQGRVFDTIICGEIIEHLENPYALLRDLLPLLAEDGRLLVSTPNPLAVPVIFAEILRLRSFFYTSDHLYYFLPRWVERLFNKTGYELESSRPVGLWAPCFVLPWVPIALSYQVIYVGRKALADHSGLRNTAN